MNTFGDTQTILVELVKAVGLAMVQRDKEFNAQRQ